MKNLPAVQVTSLVSRAASPSPTLRPNTGTRDCDIAFSLRPGVVGAEFTPDSAVDTSGGVWGCSELRPCS